MSEFTQGDLVEFTETYQQRYTIGDPELAKYGVVRESWDGKGFVKITTVEGDREIPTYLVVASGWIGFIPEDLEEIWEKLQPVDERDWSEPEGWD